ncbi:hypothetical protein JOM56_014426 [Amanita muscaria]
MVLTVIREKEKGNQRVSQSRRGALGSPKGAVPPACQIQKPAKPVNGGLNRDRRWFPRSGTQFRDTEAQVNSGSLPPDANADSHGLHGGPGGEDIVGNAHSPEAAQNACIGPLYGPPTPMVPTAIREKEKGSQRVSQSRRGALGSPKGAVPPACEIQKPAKPFNGGLDRDRRWFPRSGTQFRDTEAQVNSGCLRMGA